MPSPPGSSSASAELPPGTLIAGFRIERVIGRGSRATVYEATQLALDRRVALKLLRDRSLAERVRRLEWPEHPGAVSLFGAGDDERGPWLAMRLMPGATLATARAPLDQVAAALDCAHAAGIVHGDVSARNVLVADGRAFLSDFGLGPADATADDDRAALARLVRAAGDAPAAQTGAARDRRPLVPRRRNRRAAAAAVVAIAAIAAVALAAVLLGPLGGGEGSTGSAAAPPLAAGALAVGSDLAPGAVETVDCDGGAPSGTSQGCGISQLVLAGRETVVPIEGTITSWAVLGARGTVALQVLRERDGRLLAADRSADEAIPGPGLHVVASDLPVAAGDRIALELTPGAGAGIRRGTAGASTERWFGPLRDIARASDRPAGSGLDHELLLRVDVVTTEAVAAIAPLRGAAAASAPYGRELGTRAVGVGGGEQRTVTVVSFGAGVAVDLFDGTRRLARTAVAGADGRGQLAGLDAAPGSLRVRWRNPGGRLLDRTLMVTAGLIG